MFKAGYVSEFIHCWSELVENETFLKQLEQGVLLPFTTEPQPFHIRNNYPAIPDTHKQFISHEIHDLIQSGAIEVCDSTPAFISPIKCVPKKGKDKLRIIIDLRTLNECLDTPKFKYEDINTVLEQIEYEDQVISVDLKNGFQHILVHPAHRDFLSFEWLGVYYRFRVLPFGLACSPYYFCKFLRYVATYLRTEYHMRLCFYMDDILLMASEKDIVQQRDILLLTLQRLGWQVNLEKSHLTPSHQTTYIGYRITSDHPNN